MSASLPAEKIALVAGLGLAAYWLMQRQASGAAPLFSRNAGQTPAANLFSRQNRSPAIPAQSAQGIYDPRVLVAGAAGGLLNRLLGMGSNQSQPATPAGPAYTPYESGYPVDGSSSVDGIAANPSQDTSINVFDPYGYGAG